MKWNIKINGSFFITMVFIFVALLLYTLVYTGMEDYSDLVKAEDGIMQLTSKDLEYNIPLTGEWKYYEKELLTQSEENVSHAVIVKLPHLWHATGYGTYQLTLMGLESGKLYGLYVYDQLSAFEMYIDGQLIVANGKVGQDKSEEKVYWEPQVVTFVAEADSVDMFVQISNHFMYPGGFLRDIKIGTPYRIQNEMKSNIANQMILLGGILMIAVYHLSLFFLNPEERSGGYFALFNLVVAGRLVLIGERIINIWFDGVNWEFLLKLQFISGAAMLATLVLFMYSLFKQQNIKPFVLTVLGLLIAFCIAVFMVPENKLPTLDYIFLIITVIYFFYLLIILVFAIRKDSQGSVYSFIGVSFLLGSVLFDAFLPPGTLIIPLGIFIFLIFHSLVIGEKYARMMEQNKMLYNVAMRDGMTNLYKKTHFNKLVKTTLEEEESMLKHSILFIDIDNFKIINDNFGHEVGDEVIITTAERVLRSLRYSDIACRYGGDEFVVLLHNTKLEDSEEIASRILENILETISIGRNAIHISVSIGISCYPDDGNTIDDLINIADERMYIAKSKGKNQYASRP